MPNADLVLSYLIATVLTRCGLYAVITVSPRLLIYLFVFILQLSSWCDGAKQNYFWRDNPIHILSFSWDISFLNFHITGWLILKWFNWIIFVSILQLSTWCDGTKQNGSSPRWWCHHLWHEVHHNFSMHDGLALLPSRLTKLYRGNRKL